MRKVRGFCSLVLIGLFFLVRPVGAMEDAILAVVDDQVITVRDLQDYLQGMIMQLRIEGKSPQEIQDIVSKYQSKGVEQLIDDRLILSAADKVGMTIRPSAIQEKLAEIQKRYPTQRAFLDAIKKEGMTVSEIRKKIENQIKSQSMVSSEVRSKIAVNPQEVTDYFILHADEYKFKPRVNLSTIFVKADLARDEARKKIDQALVQIKNGEDFAKVAGVVSDLPSVNEVDEEQLRPEFRQQLSIMSVGDVSPVVEVPNGFYILKLEGRAKGRDSVLADIKDQIYQRLFEEKFRVRFQEWIEGLRKKAYVEIKN